MSFYFLFRKQSNFQGFNNRDLVIEAPEDVFANCCYHQFADGDIADFQYGSYNGYISSVYRFGFETKKERTERSWLLLYGKSIKEQKGKY